MCGIFGLIIKPGISFETDNIACDILESIAHLSESRGKDSSGFAFRNSSKRTINVIKGDIPISKLTTSELFKIVENECRISMNQGYGYCAYGHARLVTNGSQLLEVNNQPVIKDDIVTIHNGIIVNDDDLWNSNNSIVREFSIDTEIIPALLKFELDKSNDVIGSITNVFRKLQGTYSIATTTNELNQFILGTNNGSLYYLTDHKKFFLFGSEWRYLNKIRCSKLFKKVSIPTEIYQLKAKEGLIVDLINLKLKPFNFEKSTISLVKHRCNKFEIDISVVKDSKRNKEVVIDAATFQSSNQNLSKLLENNKVSISRIRRCSKCILPETFPFIHFDTDGVCNYCLNYVPKNKPKSIEKLQELVEPYRKRDGTPDCLIPFSGGRDSTFSLHFVKKELGLNPVAFTYDWGMVTDLARRNIARVCGKLGVENIIIAADIHWKRENIRRNIKAWLKYPSLGMIPLFMAGDKFFFYYTNKIKKELGIELNIWGINNLENTEFKVGFAGVPPDFEKETIYSLSFMSQLKLFSYVTKNIVKSPRYINQSIWDSIGSYGARYVAPKSDYYHLFDYYKWDENEINSVIYNEYNWETAIDTDSSWRIGDGTASFYNYIYYTVAGFSEFDTFRSNQIREGMIDRDTALKLVESENKPRFETLRWYLEIIGLDFVEVIKIINSIPKMYSNQT